MIVVEPIPVTESNLTTSNVALETAWTAGTYTTGTIRRVGTLIYEVIASPNTTDEPTAGALADPPTWVKLGSANRYSMFDNVIGRSTSNSGSIEVEITPGSVANAVALFGLSGNSVTVTVTDPIEGVVYTSTQSLVETSNVYDWYSYFFNPVIVRKRVVFLDLPNYRNAVVKVEIDAGMGTAVCGELVIGRQQMIGRTRYGITSGIRDFSITDTNDFGETSIIQRRSSRRSVLPIFVPSSQVDYVLDFLDGLRATPLVFVGSQFRRETFILGLYKDLSIVTNNYQVSECALEIEGLT